MGQEFGSNLAVELAQSFSWSAVKLLAGAAVISRLDWGEKLLPNSLTWLLSGLRISPSKLIHVVLSTRLATLQHDNWLHPGESGQDRSHSLFKILYQDWHFINFCHSPFVRSKSINSVHTLRHKITPWCEYQEVGIIGYHHRDWHNLLHLPQIPLGLHMRG